ncbi:MAG: SURF1 family cytochrome oxidase biogenesis protein [Pseudomonadota bacterium]|nr:SURF1 family cytochrome oxidase biogenesis protein [Pseudomonadota bacterium]
MILIFLIGMVLTIWQINRAQEKFVFLNTPQPTIHADHISQKHHLARTSLQGHFQTNTIFKQPRSVNHIPGHQVWVPFISNQNMVLISLGFQTDIHVPPMTEVHGTIHYINAPPFRLSNQIDTLRDTHSFTVGQLDIEQFSRLLNHKLEPYIIVLDNVIDQSLSTPSLDQVLRHINYAIQFLLFSLIACYYIYKHRK